MLVNLYSSGGKLCNMLFLLLKILIGIIIGLSIGAFFFMKYFPSFGAKAPKKGTTAFKESDHYKDNQFFYSITDIEKKTKKPYKALSNALWFIKNKIFRNPRLRPEGDLPFKKYEFRDLDSNVTSVTWFGHSSLLLEISGKRLLLDPMFGKIPSPVPYFGTRRFNQAPIDVEKIPSIDAVIFSHDHYDHLDYWTIKRIKDKVNHFFVPLGVAGHLERWNIPKNKITEIDWWNEVNFEGINLVCTPTKHFSGRSFANHTSLSCSWVIYNKKKKIFFSGDGDYEKHFKEIGEKYGPFDLTLMECGQYDIRWPNIHMFPEQSVQAHIDLKGKVMIPIHWATFALAFHDWDDSINRVIKEGEKKNIQISTPFIGERVILNDNAEYPSKKWWSELVHNNSEKDIYISEEIVDSQESYKDDYIKDIKKAN